MVASHEPIYDSINKIKGCLCVFWGTKAIFAPCKGIRIPESGKFLHLESGILEIFACGIRNPGPWNPEYRCRNPESH